MHLFHKLSTQTMLQMGGFMALEEVLAHEAEEALPEYKKRRSKYYYYYKWMRDRVTKACGELPAPVLEKLICIDATELDMLLTYPNGIKQQVNSLKIHSVSIAACHMVQVVSFFAPLSCCHVK